MRLFLSICKAFLRSPEFRALIANYLMQFVMPPIRFTRWKLHRFQHGLTRDNMTDAELAADDATWADWFQAHAWKSLKASAEDRPALKREIDFMARQRMIGLHHSTATKAFAKDEPWQGKSKQYDGPLNDGGAV